MLEETTAADTIVLGTVRTDAGPIVVARVEGASPGERVALRVDDGALTARRGLSQAGAGFQRCPAGRSPSGSNDRGGGLGPSRRPSIGRRLPAWYWTIHSVSP